MIEESRQKFCTREKLDEEKATKACKTMGWTVGWIGDKSLICTAPGISYDNDCNSCETWRLLVWEDGGRDRLHGGEKYNTKAGRSYGGHNPCKEGWSLVQCHGSWI